MSTVLVRMHVPVVVHARGLGEDACPCALDVWSRVRMKIAEPLLRRHSIRMHVRAQVSRRYNEFLLLQDLLFRVESLQLQRLNMMQRIVDDPRRGNRTGPEGWVVVRHRRFNPRPIVHCDEGGELVNWSGATQLDNPAVL